MIEYKGASYNALSAKQCSDSKSVALFSNPPPLSGLILLPATSSFFFQRSQKNLFCVDRRGESKNDGAPVTFLRKTVCTIASHSGSIACSCVETRKGATLRANANDFLNCVCKKIYSISCTIFAKDHELQQQRRELHTCPFLSLCLSIYIYIPYFSIDNARYL